MQDYLIYHSQFHFVTWLVFFVFIFVPHRFVFGDIMELALGQSETPHPSLLLEGSVLPTIPTMGAIASKQP